jgi:hypothetical protein
MHNVELSQIEAMIYVVRGIKVMMDSDIADLYGVETKTLKRAVRRHLNRFPSDFMFEMTKIELENWRNQFGTSNSVKMGLRVQPFVFTELGVAMLSSVLNSDQAISVNISIMRIFAKHRSFLLLEKQMSDRMDKIEKGTNKLFQVVFERLDSVEESLEPSLSGNQKKIGLK